MDKYNTIASVLIGAYTLPSCPYRAHQKISWARGLTQITTHLGPPSVTHRETHQHSTSDRRLAAQRMLMDPAWFSDVNPMCFSIIGPTSVSNVNPMYLSG